MRLTAFPIAFALLAIPSAAIAFAQPSDQPPTAQVDAAFLNAANQGSVDEIHLAQLALTKSTNPDVKAFAQQMVHDHGQLLDDMKPFDKEAGITIPDHPSDSALAEEAKLKSLTGEAFDKEYIQQMVEGHFNALVDFVAEEQKMTAPAFKDAVVKGQQVVRNHLERINLIAEDHGLAGERLPPA